MLRALDGALGAQAARDPAAARRRAIWLLAAGQTVAWTGLLYSFAALFLSWEQDLGWDKADIALGLTAALGVSAVASPRMGGLIDAGHGRWVMSGGLLFGALLLAGVAFARSQPVFVALWAVIGLGQAACLYIPCFSFVTRVLGAEARPAITRITLVAGFASMIAFPTGALLADALGWRGAVLVFSASLVLLGVPLLYAGAVLLDAATPDKPPAAPKAENRAAIRAAMRKPQFWLICAAFPMMSLGHGMLLNHIVPLLVERGLTEPTAVAAASVIGPMQVAGRVAMMRMERFAGTLTLTLVSFGGGVTAALILLAAGASAPLVFAFAAVQGASYGLISILQPVLTAEELGRAAFGAISGRLAVPYVGAFACAPWLAALLWEEGGYDLTVAAAGGLAAVGFGCIGAIGLLAARNR